MTDLNTLGDKKHKGGNVMLKLFKFIREAFLTSFLLILFIVSISIICEDDCIYLNNLVSILLGYIAAFVLTFPIIVKL